MKNDKELLIRQIFHHVVFGVKLVRDWRQLALKLSRVQNAQLCLIVLLRIGRLQSVRAQVHTLVGRLHITRQQLGSVVFGLGSSASLDL